MEVSFVDDAGTAEGPLASAAYPSTGTVAANAAPTGADNTVTTVEDRAYTLQASDFGFTDTDTDDALVSVQIISLPASGELRLDGVVPAAGDLPKTVTATELGDSKLVFSPDANADGAGYASFTFKVSDGVAESASSNTLTIDVTAVNDAATGTPAITGTARVGRTLTAATAGIADVEGVTKAAAGDEGHAFTYQWVRVDADGTSNAVDITDATASTYTLSAADFGNRVKVEVSFTDDAGTAEGPLTSAAYPSTGTVAANTAPAGADKTVTTAEDRAYRFQARDFGFADPDTGDTLASVKIISLPAAGTLSVDGVALASGDLPQAVSAAELGDGKLEFSPAANASGSGYASFTFKVSDGVAESASSNTLTIDVTAVNDAATGTPAITGRARTGRTLTASTAGIADVEGVTKAAARRGGPCVHLPVGASRQRRHVERGGHHGRDRFDLHPERGGRR